MDRRVAAFALATVLLVAVGCEDSQPVSTMRTPTAGQTGTPAPTPSSNVRMSSELRAYFGAVKDLTEVCREIATTLGSVTDAYSASQAAARLAPLTPRLETAMRAATARLVAVEKSPTARQEHRRILAPATEADARFAQQVMADLKVTNEMYEDLSIPDLLMKTAKQAGTGPLRGELQKLRDVLLRGRAPLAPVTVRRRLEQKLGPLGSPLRTQ